MVWTIVAENTESWPLALKKKLITFSLLLTFLLFSNNRSANLWPSSARVWVPIQSWRCTWSHRCSALCSNPNGILLICNQKEKKISLPLKENVIDLFEVTSDNCIYICWIRIEYSKQLLDISLMVYLATSGNFGCLQVKKTILLIFPGEHPGFPKEWGGERAGAATCTVWYCGTVPSAPGLLFPHQCRQTALQEPLGIVWVPKGSENPPHPFTLPLPA